MGVTVSALIAALKDEHLLERVCLLSLKEDFVVTDLSFDNRTVRSGGLFACKGAAFRPTYLQKAREAGAALYVSQTVWDETMPYFLVKDIRRAMAVLARAFYAEDADKVVKIGITGTKGKTTVVSFLNAILNCEAKRRGAHETAVLSSLMIYDGEKRREASLSTPEAFDLWKSLASAGKKELGYAVCEVSSQALKYHRTYGIAFDVAAFLNIGEDHISAIEHRDFEDYFASKLRLLDSSRVVCLFSGAAHFDRMAARAEAAHCQIRTFGYQTGDTVYCVSRSCLTNKSVFTVLFSETGEKERFEIALAGRYNVDNALAAIALAETLGISHEAMKAGLFQTTVAGRGEHLTTSDGAINVIVDYAHNKMSLEALLTYVAETYPTKPIVTLFGCPGGKAQNRRRDMGLLAGALSDYVLLTEDDPANESLDAICREIAQYVEKGRAVYRIVPDRAEAIRQAFAFVNSGGVILLCGKGAEKTQKRAEGAIPYETDKYIAQQCIQNYEASLTNKVAVT